MTFLKRFTALLVIGYTVSMIAAAIVVHTLGDRTPIGTLALFAPRHLMPWPWLLLTPLAALVSWRLVATAAAGLLITLLGVASWAVPTPAGDRPDDPLRVVFYNTDRSTALASRVSGDVQAWDADFVALVDCRTEVAEQMQRVDGYQFVRTPFVCVLSRHRIVSHAPMPSGPINPRRTPGAGRASRVHRFVLDVSGQLATIYVLHLESPRTALFRARNFDFSLLRQNTGFRSIDSNVASIWVDRSAPGLLVLGDFNITVESAIYKRDWSDLQNVFTKVGTGFGHTMFAGRHRVRIDHMLTGDDLKPHNIRILRGYPSEHQPVIAEFSRR